MKEPGWILLAISIFVSPILSGCGGSTTAVSPQQDVLPIELVAQMPAGVVKEPDCIYVDGKAESKDKEMALQTAKHEARLKIARLVEARIDQLLHRSPKAGSLEENDNFRHNAYTEIILRGAKTAKQEIEQSGVLYRAHVLMKIPARQVDLALVARVRSDANLRHRLESTDEFIRLEQRVDSSP